MENRITDGIPFEIRKILNIAMDKDDQDLFLVVDKFISDVMILSVEKLSISHFSEYAFLPAHCYRYSHSSFKRKDQGSFHHQSRTENMARLLRDMAWLRIGPALRRSEDDNDKAKLNELYRWCFTGLAEMAYASIRRHDLWATRFCVSQVREATFSGKNYRQQVENKRWQISHEAEPSAKLDEINSELVIAKRCEGFMRHALMSIRYWSIYLFDLGILNSKDVKVILEFSKVHYHVGNEMLNDIIYIREQSYKGYLNLNAWDYKHRGSEPYTLPSPFHWVTLGFFCDNILQNQLYVDFQEIDFTSFDGIKHLYRDLKDIRSMIINQSEKWLELFELGTEAELDKRLEDLLNVFAVLNRKKVGQEEKAIALAAINRDIETEFIKAVGNSWSNAGLAHLLCDYFRDSLVTRRVGDRLVPLGLEIFYGDGKKMFLSDFESVGPSSLVHLGSRVTEYEDSLFFQKILNSDSKRISKSNEIEVIDVAVEDLRKNQMNPSVILISTFANIKFRELWNDSKFVSKEMELNDDIPKLRTYLGRYKGISVFYSPHGLNDNQIVVMDFTKAMTFIQRRSKKWYKDLLEVSVQPFTERKARAVLHADPIRWRKTDDGIDLTEAEAIIAIQNSVIIKVSSHIDFDVRNHNAIRIGIIQ